MSAFYEYLPLLISISVMLAMFGITYLLYLRWRTKNYLFMFSTAGIGALLHCIVFLVAAIRTGSFSHDLQLAVSSITFIAMVAALVHFLLPKKKKELYFILAAAAATLILSSLIFLQSVIALLVMTILVMAGIGYIVIIQVPIFPKSLQFRIAFLLFLTGFLVYVVSLLVNVPGIFMIASVLSSSAHACLLLIFYSRLVDMVEAVSVSAVTDGLTGLYNKVHFIKKVREAIETEQVQGIIFTDIDNFKKLNDTQGHPVGDQILKLVARIFQETCRGAGLVGRYGGEEMVALITNKKFNVEQLAERFRAHVEQATPEIYPVTVSVGVSVYSADMTAEEIIKQADDAMYSAKRQGKNRVVSYGDHQISTHTEVLPEKIIKEADPEPDAEKPVEKKPISFMDQID